MNTSANADMHPEMGNVISLDHVNLKVSDQGLATLFFVEGLGLTRDPYRMAGTGNMWVNLGRQQCHLPTKAPMPFPGAIGLVVPDLEQVAAGLERIQPGLAATKAQWELSKGLLAVTDPWGRRLRLHPPQPALGNLPLGLCYVEFTIPPGAAAKVGDFYREGLGCPVFQTAGGPAPETRV